MDFKIVNERFIALCKKTYGIIDIKEFDFIPQQSNVLICFVVKTEKEKTIFLMDTFGKCCEDYLNFVNDHNEYKNFEYKFMVLSKEEVKDKYDGNYYYAML